MYLFKNCVKTLGLIILMSSGSVAASTLVPDTVLAVTKQDPGQGNGSTASNGYAYDIDSMAVNWASNDMITVDIMTNFAKGNNTQFNYGNSVETGTQYGKKQKKIIYGDLLIGAQDGVNDATSASSFNYAFSLGDFISDSYLIYQNFFSGNSQDTWSAQRYYDGNQTEQKSGGLYAINGTETAGEFHNTSKSGSVFGDTVGSELNADDSSWSVDTATGKISFSFSVAGIDAFRDATALSLSWAMSCYNDAVHDSWELTRTTGGGGGGGVSVPEPQMALLMLLGLAGIAARRKKQSFKA